MVFGVTESILKYYFAAGKRIAMRQDSVVTFLLADHLGSTSVTTDSTGVLVSSMLYTAFGETRSSTGMTTSEYLYTGQYQAEAGLYFYNARWYDPLLGRFAQADSITHDLYNTQDWNRYTYVRDNPLKFTDPEGHFPWPVLAILVIVGVALSGDTIVDNPFRQFPVNAYSLSPCVTSVDGCFGDTVFLKDFSENGIENPIQIEEFNLLANEVAYDLYSHDLTWPGIIAGRQAYDTPFYNGGESKKRTGNINSEQGIYPSNQQVCIETIGCSGRSEINYFAQGMWGAAVGEPKIISQGITAAWKLWEYSEWPSESTFFWLNYGYDYYNQWFEHQAK